MIAAARRRYSSSSSPTSSSARLERELGGVLDEPRRAVQHAHREVDQVLGELDRADRPARAPAGHRVRLREARDRDDAIGETGQREHADVLDAERQLGVDLVADRARGRALRQISPTATSSSRVITAPVGLCGEVSSTARVRGVTARSTSAGSRWKPRSGGSGTLTIARAGRAEHRLVGDVGRLGHDHLVARRRGRTGRRRRAPSARRGRRRPARARSRSTRARRRAARPPRAGPPCPPAACSACARLRSARTPASTIAGGVSMSLSPMLSTITSSPRSTRRIARSWTAHASAPAPRIRSVSEA